MGLKEDIQDEILVLRCQQGDAAAFAALFDRWHPRLVRVASRMVRDRQAVLDIVQETWLAVIRGMRRLDDVNAFTRWVFRILHNKCNDWLRRRHRQHRLHDDLASQQVDQAYAPISSQPRFDSVREAMDTLPAEQSELLTLYYIENLSVSDIAEIVNIPYGTVKSRLYHARKRLRAILTEGEES